MDFTVLKDFGTRDSVQKYLRETRVQRTGIAGWSSPVFCSHHAKSTGHQTSLGATVISSGWVMPTSSMQNWPSLGNPPALTHLGKRRWPCLIGCYNRSQQSKRRAAATAPAGPSNSGPLLATDQRSQSPGVRGCLRKLFLREVVILRGPLFRPESVGT
jgi:hypothetical protein